MPGLCGRTERPGASPASGARAGRREDPADRPAVRARRLGIGLGETAQSAAIATHSQPELRSSVFGLVSGVQAFANLTASAIAGVLWTAVSPTAAFLYLAGWSAIALLVFLGSLSGERGTTPEM